MANNLKDILEKIFGDLAPSQLFINVDLTSLTTMRLKSIGHYALVKNQDNLIKLILRLKEEMIEYRLIGWGANQLIPYDSSKVLYIKLDFPNVLDNEIQKTHYEFNASTPLSNLVSISMKLGNIGWEALTGIPASVGGAIFMNAGTKLGEVASLLKSVNVLRAKGNIEEVFITKDSFSYRKNHFLDSGDIILSGVFTQIGFDQEKIPQKIKEYMSYRKSTQPLKSHNCGCVFKNPPGESAGRIIEECGLKGFKYKNLVVSTIHANFIENIGDANLEDFVGLVNHIRETVYKKYQIELELEVKFF